MEKKSARKKREKKTEENKKETEKETKDEIHEIFDTEKNEEETVKIPETEENKVESKEQIEKENRLLRNVFIIMVGLSLFFLAGYFVIQSLSHFDYEGVKFDVVKEGSLLLYRTTLPGKITPGTGAFILGIYKDGNLANYRIWLRNDPRWLKNIPFDGYLSLKTDMVINATQGFTCEGDGNIAFANLLKLYEVIKIRVVKDENASCDPEGRYMFLRVQEGDKTEIKQFGASCYDVYIKDCEILDGLERFMLETFVEVNKELKRKE